MNKLRTRVGEWGTSLNKVRVMKHGPWVFVIDIML